MDIRLSLVVVSVLVFHCAYARVIDEASREEKDETGRIIRGQDARAGQFPYACALHYNGDFICTCSIISGLDVLTAAHCVYMNGTNQPADKFYAIANVSRSAPSVRIDFADRTVHPDYNDGTINNDIALFRASQEIPVTDESKPVCIARADTPMMEYRNATAMGWGVNEDSNVPETLQYVVQRIVSNLECSILLTPGVNDDKICAKRFFSGICYGDSGGPLVHLSRDKPDVQLGITSYINGLLGCANPISSAVFTRVSSFTPWIMQEAAQPSGICTV